jgi:hypothetical protein
MKDENDKTSMLYWYPKVKDLDIPQPRTIIVNLTAEEVARYNDLDSDSPSVPQLVYRLKEIIKAQFGYPVFLRTDHTSSKHYWDKTCYVPTEDVLADHVFELLSFSKLADLFGLPCNAIVVREFIPMAMMFKAFLGMPVNPEIRYFIHDGRILCKHWYWVEEAIQNGTPKDQLPENWIDLLYQARNIPPHEEELLESYCQKVIDRFPEGYWSVDFCKGKDGKWYLIDMAEGHKSWHPNECHKRPGVEGG